MNAHWCAGKHRYVRALLASWVKPSGDPTVRSTHSNRARGRPCQTLRHGYRNTLRFFGFDDVGSVDLQIWMVEARDVDRWGARVEDTLGLEPGSFKSLYHAQNNFGWLFYYWFHRRLDVRVFVLPYSRGRDLHLWETLDGKLRPTGETKPQNEFILFCWLTTNSFW